MAEGRVVIPRNVAGRARPQGIGEGLRVKINADVGSSKGRAAKEEELRKARIDQVILARYGELDQTHAFSVRVQTV